MSLLAFDPERLAWLRAAMVRAVGDLDALQCTDPLAEDGRRRIRSARAAIADTWLPVVGNVLACTAATAYGRTVLDGITAPTIGIAALVRLGWAVAADPLVSTVPVVLTAAEIGLLADLLGSGEVVDLLVSTDDVLALVERLRLVAVTPGAAAALLAAAGWDWEMAVGGLADARAMVAAELAAELAAEPSGADADDRRAHLAALDQAMAILVSIVVAPMPPAARRDWAREAAEHLDPYAAALVVRVLAPTGRQLGELTATILGRWVDGAWPDRELPVPGWPGGPRTADLLLPLVADDPVAALVVARAAAQRPEILFETTDDGSLVTTVLSTATDPAEVDVATAGAVLRPILDWLRIEDVWRHSPMIGDFAARPAMVLVLVPWLLQLDGRTDDWGWSTEEGHDVLRWLADDDAAMDRLVAASVAWRAQLDGSFVLDDGTVDVAGLDAVAGMLDQLGRTLLAENIDDAVARRWVADQIIGIIRDLVGALAARLPAPLSSAGGFAGTHGVDALMDWLTERGVLPPDGEKATADGEQQFATQAAAVTVTAVAATVARFVDLGALPSTALDALDDALAEDAGEECATRDLHERLLAFVESWQGRCEPAVFNAMIAVLQTFQSPAAVNEACD